MTAIERVERFIGELPTDTPVEIPWHGYKIDVGTLREVVALAKRAPRELTKAETRELMRALNRSAELRAESKRKPRAKGKR